MFAQKPGMDMVLFAMASQALSLCYHLLIFWTKMCQRVRSANANTNNNNIGFVSISLYLVLAIQVVLSLLPLSNSYIIYESDVLSFVLKSFICWMILQYFNKHRWEFSYHTCFFCCIFAFIIFGLAPLRYGTLSYFCCNNKKFR